jgi:serine/threonine-protein kinase RsbW
MPKPQTDTGTALLRLLHRPASVPHVRRWARGLAVERWALPIGEADDLALVVGELAGNVLKHVPRVVHGRERGFRVLLSGADDGAVRVEVQDAADLGPAAALRVADPGPEDTGGRGLLLVETLSLAWGVSVRAPEGKAVWAVVGPGGGVAGRTVEECRHVGGISTSP